MKGRFRSAKQIGKGSSFSTPPIIPLYPKRNPTPIIMVEVKWVNTKAQLAIVFHGEVKMDEIPQFMGKAFGALMMFAQRKKVQLAGPAFCYYRSWSKTTVDLECGFPVAGPVEGEGDVRMFSLPAAKAANAMHLGPYERVGTTYGLVEQWLRAHGHEPSGQMWEVYHNSPQDTAPKKLRTEIFWPVKRLKKPSDKGGGPPSPPTTG